ncbi:PAP/25A associated domain protein, partial [Teladorsagia circumcincta]
SNNLTSGTQSFAAAAASGLSSCVQTSVASATAAATTTAAAAAATTAVETPITVPTCPTPPTSQLGRGVQFEISEMDVLSEEIWHYHNSVTQSEKMLNRKLHLRDMLYYSICPVFPMCGLYVVGSSLNGFGNNTSDMDLCLMITNKDLDQKTDAVVVLNMILSTLQHTEWVSHQKLILAKVPILRIKFAPPFSDITVDLNANNSVAIKNTHLLCYYSSFDWRVRPLVSVVKEWAKRKGINDANRSSFTSGTEPGVLPSLQQMFPRRFANKCDVRTLNVTLPLETPTASEWQYADKSTLGELLIGFLDYYANKFDYDRDAISVRLGKRIDRAVIARQRPNGGYQQNGTNWRSQWRCICIEEPFTYSNTAHSIYDEMVFDAIKTAFREAHQELDTTRDLQRLLNCKPITVNAPMGGAMVYVSSYSSTREMSAGSTAGGTEPGVLPSLQQMFPRRFANKCDVRTLNVTLPLETPTASEWQYADKSTLGELLIGFLDYYANKFDYDRDAISVRLGKRIDRAVIARQRPNGGYQQNGTNWRSQWRCICIEEPFTYSNTAHSIYDEMVFDAIKTAFREAHQELDTTRDLQRLLNCKPITVNAPMGGAMVYVSSYSSTREMSAGSTAGDSPMSGHSRRSTPRGSSSGSSISTAHSAASSSGSSSSSDYGEDQDHDRLTDVADVSSVPLQRQTKPRSRRISRPNGSIPSCLPTSPPKIPVTTAAEQ